MSIYDNEIEVRQLTREAIAATKSKLLQIHRFAVWDDLHVKTLLEVFQPMPFARIADVGCGVGEMAELMSIQRPDLKFTLINKSRSQLDMCPTGFDTLSGVAEDLPLGNKSVDAVMVAYVLGHVGLHQFLSECDRVTGPDGRIYVYDIFKDDEKQPCRYGLDLDYTERTQNEVISMFEDQGFKFSHSRTTAFELPLVSDLMPHRDTLRNTISAAMVFKRA